MHHALYNFKFYVWYFDKGFIKMKSTFYNIKHWNLALCPVDIATEGNVGWHVFLKIYFQQHYNNK